MFLYPFYNLFYLQHKFEHLDEAGFKAKYHSMYLELRTESEFAIAYTFVFFVRRFLLILLVHEISKEHGDMMLLAFMIL